MANNEKKDYLIGLFRGLPMTALEIEHEKTVELTDIHFSEEEAKKEILNQSREILKRGGDIVDTIVRRGRYVAELDAVIVRNDFNDLIVVDKSEVPDYDERYYNSYIDYISGQLSGYNFTVSNGKLVNDSEGFVKEMRKVFIAYEIVTHLTNEKRFIAEVKEEKEKETKVSIKEIALLHIYLGTVITKENVSDLVKSYGYSSGDKLYNEYTSFLKVASRRRLPEQCTPLKYRNRLALFEKVIEMLPEEKKEAARVDLKHIKDKYEE